MDRTTPEAHSTVAPYAELDAIGEYRRQQSVKVDSTWPCVYDNLYSQ